MMRGIIVVVVVVGQQSVIHVALDVDDILRDKSSPRCAFRLARARARTQQLRTVLCTLFHPRVRYTPRTSSIHGTRTLLPCQMRCDITSPCHPRRSRSIGLLPSPRILQRRAMVARTTYDLDPNWFRIFTADTVRLKKSRR